MIETGTPIRARRAAPAARALALADRLALAAAGAARLRAEPAQAQGRRRPADHPRHRDRAAAARLRRRRSCAPPGLPSRTSASSCINDRAFNAFVMDGRHIFINAGALFDAKTPNEVIGVLAHETGHLAGGHLSRLREQARRRRRPQSIIAMLLGVGALVAGARAGSGAMPARRRSSAPQATIQRSLLAYVRTQEDQADHAGVKFLNATGQSAKGMYDTVQAPEQRNVVQCALYRSLPADPSDAGRARRRARADLAKASPYWDKKDPPELQLRHDLMRAKLVRLPRASGHGGAPLSARATPACRRAMRAPSRPIATPICAGAIAQIDALDPGAAEQSLFLRAQGPGAARRRPRRRGDRAAAPRRRARATAAR